LQIGLGDGRADLRVISCPAMKDQGEGEKGGYRM
jgi:hypothetical protein